MARDIFQASRLLIEEVVMLGGIGIEIGPSRIDHDLAQHTGRGELVERIVNRRQGNPYIVGDRLTVQLFRRNMAVAVSNSSLAKAKRWRVGLNPATRKRSRAWLKGLWRIALILGGLPPGALHPGIFIPVNIMS